MWSKTIWHGKRASIAAFSAIMSPGQWSCTCQPNGAMRFASGSTMSSDTTAVAGSPSVKRMPRMPPASSCFRLGVRNVRMDDRDAAGIGAELRYGIERHLVVGGMISRLHHHHAGRAVAFLQQAVVCHRRVGDRRPRRDLRKARVVNVHVAVGGVRWRLQLRPRRPCGMRHYLFFITHHASPITLSRGRA